MSELLGSLDCIESLRRDLVDLQGVIVDVISRTGPVRFSSWKFPDKLSCNLDMVALLEKYDFADGENAFNQHSHIVLMELVIDRLLLLLQCFNAYVEQVRCNQRGQQSQQSGCLSVGLVVRSYWSDLVEFINIKGISSDVKKQTKSRTVDSDEKNTVPTFSHHTTSINVPLSSTSSAKFSSQNHLPSSPAHNNPFLPKADNRSVGCQTVESSLVPCDACHQVQSILKRSGDTLVQLFQSEGLPSSLQELFAAVEATVELGHMTAADLTQWANEQLRDMQRLAKHLQEVRGTVEPLRERLVEAETERDRFSSELSQAQNNFKQELEKHQANTVQLEFSLNKAQRCVKETEQRLQAQQQQHKKVTLCLEENNSRLKDKVSAHEDALQSLECEKNTLEEKVRMFRIEEEVCSKQQQTIQQLEERISETQLHLDKEKVKYQGACRQHELMQAKQQSLIKRVDALYDECEELKGQLGECEERWADLQNQLKQMSEEKKQAHAQFTEQQGLCSKLQEETETQERHISKLKSSVADLKEYVQTLQERERLLVAFPELNPLQLQPKSTGNVLLDMEQQLQANSIRINALKQENATLHNSIVKLRERAQKNASREASPQETQQHSLLSTQVKTRQNEMTQRPLQSSKVTQLGYSNSRKECVRQQSGHESAEVPNCTSTTPTISPPYQQHLQTIHINFDSVAQKSHTKLQNSSPFSRRK